MTVKVNEQKTKEQILESARRIGKAAEAESLQADLDATLSENIIDIIREEQINKLILPKQFGGPQIDFTTFAEMVKEVGYYNLSAAWITYFFSLHNGWVAYLPEHRQQEIVDSDGLLADIFAPIGKIDKVDGGFILSGKYNYVSGINYSGWVALGAFHQPEGAESPSMHGFVVNTDDLEIIENWNSLGLRGSGSNTVIADKVFVPDDMIVDLKEMADKARPAHNNYDVDYLYYHVPFHPAFFVGFPAMSIGGAERALDEFKKSTMGRVRLDGEKEMANPRSQRVLATLTIKLTSAKSLMRTYIDMLESKEKTYHPSEFKAIRAEIIQNCVDIAVKCLLTLGASALLKGHPIEIITRDLLAIATHVTSLYEDAIDVYGKHLFDYPVFVMG
ncbi:acyl-CoA dehydrogenase family protein [Aquibacillus saliphilus]|uniref:acyl-CoA dehydrogenase family protein n=1 Tax=Aquibacillus saliphilus TaxID=1909422 RepID=UPI001CF0A3F3|nr:acyl-CoA dehydrogenase family protein [Aquibacillus saliphilus]